MKKIFTTLIGCVMAVAASAQVVLVTSAAPKGSSYLNVDHNSETLLFEAEGGESSIGVTTNLNYTLSSDADWCAASRQAGSLVIKAGSNTGGDARSATVGIGARDGFSRTIGVGQLGTDPAILASTGEVVLNDNATDFTVTVASNTEVSVELPEWITTSTTGEKGIVTYSFKATQLENAGDSRTGVITFSDRSGKAGSVAVNVEQYFKGYPRFAVISDTHFGNNWDEGPMVKVPKALNNLLSQSPRVDAIFICGDLTDWGTPEQYKLFRQVFDNTDIVPADLPVYVMMGNHDNYADNALKNYLVLDQPYHRLIDIKGFPFITTSMNGGGWDDYAPEEVKALEENLAKAAKEYPGKPIFVFTHVPPMNTVYGTCEGEGGWGSNVLTNALKKYPQIVVFGGHSHFPLADPRSIHQGDFTTINDGSTTYSEIEPGVVNEGIHPDKCGYVTEGCIVNVHNNLDVEIERWDTYGNEEILPRWTVKAPHDGSQFVYTSARTGGDAPQWAAGDACTVTDVADGNCTVNFPAAVDDENVHHYVIELVNDNGEVLATHSRFSGYYLNSRAPESFSVRMEGIPDGETMKARVKALDSYKNASGYLVSEAFTTNAYVPDPAAKLPVADLFDIRFNEDGTATDVSSRNITVRSGDERPATYFNESYNRQTATFSGSRDCFYRVDYADDQAIKSAFANGFTFESFYKPNDTGNVCPMSAQESGGAGIEQASGGLIQFYCHVGGSYKVLKTSVTAKEGTFYHVVVSYDKSAGKIYAFVNGRPAGELEAGGSFGMPSDADAHWIAIGGDCNGSGRAQYSLDGDIAIARMYGKSLTRDEAFLLYRDATNAEYKPSPDAEKPVADLFDVQFNEDGTATDLSAHKAEVKNSGKMPVVTYNETYRRNMATFPAENNCFYRIDFENDEAIRNALSDGFSLEVLYKTNNTNNVCPLSAQESGGAGVEQASGGLIQFYCHVGGGYKVVKSDVTAREGNYYHVVAVYDKNEGVVRMYIDGRPAGTVEAGGNFGFPKADARWFCIGGDANPSGNGQFMLDGDVVVARMYGKALKRDEAYLLYKDLETE